MNEPTGGASYVLFLLLNKIIRFGVLVFPRSSMPERLKLTLAAVIICSRIKARNKERHTLSVGCL